LGELLGQDFPSHCGRRLAERNRTPGGIAFLVLGTPDLADPGLLLTEVVIDTEEVERSRDDGEIPVLHRKSHTFFREVGDDVGRVFGLH
jgi:hypothetical protein